MKIVVTGGSGTVGKYVVDELRMGNHDVTVLARGKTGATSLGTMDATFCKGDICTLECCKKAFRGAEAVIHLAAIPHLFTEPPEQVFQINVIGTFNVFQAASDLGVEKVVYASSDSSYGFNWRNSFSDILLPEYLPIDETHPQKPKDAYGLSKKVGEEIARTFTRKYGVTTISLRIAHVRIPEKSGPVGIEAYQKEMKEKGRMLPPFVYNEAGNITQIFCYNDARDVAQAFRLAIESKALKGENGEFNICADDNVGNLDTMDFLRIIGWDKVRLNKEIRGRQSLFAFSKAKRVLGYQPRYNWYNLYIQEGYMTKK